MLPSDRGTRDLLPPIEADRHEVAGPAATVAGSLGLASDIPLLAIPPATHPGADLPAEQESGPTGQATGGYPAMPIETAAPSIDAHHVSDMPGGEAEGPSPIAIPAARNFSGPEPPVIMGREGADSPDRPQGELDGQGEREGKASMSRKTGTTCKLSQTAMTPATAPAPVRTTAGWPRSTTTTTLM